MTNTINNTFKQTSRLSELWDDLLSDPVPPRPTASKRMTPAASWEVGDPASPPFAPDLKHPSVCEPDRFPDAPMPATRIWKNSVGKVLHNLLEPANAEPEVSSEMSIEAAHEEALSLISPFRWDPKPAWINPPIQQRPPLSNQAAPHRAVTRPKIPLRPLHKRPFYMRFYFYLHHWLINPK